MPSSIVNVDGTNSLRVPLQTQPNREAECLLYSISMVLRYCCEIHPSQKLREGTVMLSPDEMKNDHVRIRDSGWSPSPSDLEAFSEELGIIDLEMKYWKNTPPLSAFDDTVDRNLEQNLPTIVVVDAKKIQGIDSTDGQHATVVTGKSDNHIVLADPWQRGLRKLNKEIVTDAWDTQLNRLITIDTSVQDSLQQNTQLTDLS